MQYNFDHSSPRENSNALKYTMRKELFKTDDLLPVWVADMDIDTPAFVLDAVRDRLRHPVVGYERIPTSALQAQCDWMMDKYRLALEPQDIYYSHSVVASMRVAIEAFSEKGEGVIVQTPVYPPFFQSVIELDRKLLKNRLKRDENGYYRVDIQHLKSIIDKDTKLLLLCSPHNPVGRVWREDELKEILDICYEHNIVIFSDEIHSDLVYKGYKHTPMLCLGDKAKKSVISAIGVTKTFNMAGFAISSIVVQDKDLKTRFDKIYNKIHFAEGNVLSYVAFEAAYKNGKEWLEQLKKHLYKNYLLLENLCKKYPEYIYLTPIEATYLAWLDCRGLGLRDKNLREFFTKEAKLGLNAGISFSKEGSGFMRLNFAVSSAKMSEVLYRLENALHKRKQSDKNKLG
jgi:cystathionine beta-lyase